MKNLKSILSVIIDYELRKDNIILNQNEINYINNLIQSYPQIFNSISNEIQNICSDGKIDFYDIPQIIILISNIYKNHIIEESIQNIDIVSIVRFTINTILHAGILPLNNIEIDISFVNTLENSSLYTLQSDKFIIIEKIIDSSIDLLKMNIDIKKDKEYCYNLLCNIQ
jgi:hypothetical protein